MDSEVRQRKPEPPTSTPTHSSKTLTEVEVEDNSSSVISLLDVLRVIFALVGITCAASYYVTSGDSIIFGWPRPWFTKPAELKHYLQGAVNLTPAELLKYDGSDPSLPIYLAINGTIFDVSAGAHTYGPGGSYSIFAGRDASRAFVTGCFLEDRTSDLRGAENMYLAIENQPDENILSTDRKIRAEREKREAKKKVQDEVDRWVNFYKNSEKYFEVGKVVGVDEKDLGPVPTLCASAEKGRPKRKTMNLKLDSNGKPIP